MRLNPAHNPRRLYNLANTPCDCYLLGTQAMTKWIKTLLLACCAFYAGVAAGQDGQISARQPNLVLIVADDCTYLDLGVYGGQAKTPHLDRLASQGMKITRCFQAAPMCSPTRHNLYTGIGPVKSGAWPNHTLVYDGTQSIAHYLQDAGYRVALSGKTHIGPKDAFPFEFIPGFDKADPNKDNPYPGIENLIREAKRDNQPFCLIACSREPHSPYDKGDASAYPPAELTLPPNWVDTPETRRAYANYLAEVTHFDAQCGALIDLIGRKGVADDTLVMVLSEQGSGFPFAKWTCYEMGLASGMIVRWPGTIESGSTRDALVEYVDVTPTFLAAAGLPTPETMDGKSFLPVLLGDAEEHKQYTFGIHTTRTIHNGSEVFGIRSVGTKTHRYIRNLHLEATFQNNVTADRVKGAPSGGPGSPKPKLATSTPKPWSTSTSTARPRNSTTSRTIRTASTT